MYQGEMETTDKNRNVNVSISIESNVKKVKK